MNEVYQGLWDEFDKELDIRDGRALLEWLDKVFDEALTHSSFVPFGVQVAIRLRAKWPRYNVLMVDEQAELCEVIDSCIKTLTAHRDKPPRELYKESANLVKGWLKRHQAQVAE